MCAARRRDARGRAFFQRCRAHARSINHQRSPHSRARPRDARCPRAGPYEDLVVEGETHHCDTLGAMLKMLKKAKVITFNQMFLMYPMHKEEIVTLIDMDFDPETAS